MKIRTKLLIALIVIVVILLAVVAGYLIGHNNLVPTIITVTIYPPTPPTSDWGSYIPWSRVGQLADL